jgi:hypothetical protein
LTTLLHIEISHHILSHLKEVSEAFGGFMCGLRYYIKFPLVLWENPYCFYINVKEQKPFNKTVLKLHKLLLNITQKYLDVRYMK